MSEELVREWVSKAEEDFQVAMTLSFDDFPNAVCFHCQQSAEKYLKSILIANDEKPPRTHDLLLLNELASRHHDELKKLSDTLEELNPYSVEF